MNALWNIVKPRLALAMMAMIHDAYFDEAIKNGSGAVNARAYDDVRQMRPQ